MVDGDRERKQRRQASKMSQIDCAKFSLQLIVREVAFSANEARN